MNKKQALALGLGVIAVIFYLAVTFNILPNIIGLFGDVVFSMLSGLTWILCPRKKRKTKNTPTDYGFIKNISKFLRRTWRCA
jgi:hypothetical protein